MARYKVDKIKISAIGWSRYCPSDELITGERSVKLYSSIQFVNIIMATNV